MRKRPMPEFPGMQSYCLTSFDPFDHFGKAHMYFSTCKEVAPADENAFLAQLADARGSKP